MLDNVFSLKNRAQATAGRGSRGKTSPVKMLQTLGDVGPRDPPSLLLMWMCADVNVCWCYTAQQQLEQHWGVWRWHLCWELSLSCHAMPRVSQGQAAEKDSAIWGSAACLLKSSAIRLIVPSPSSLRMILSFNDILFCVKQSLVLNVRYMPCGHIA